MILNPVVQIPRLLDGSLNEVRRIPPVSLSITEDIVPLSTATLTVRNGESIPDRSWMELYTVNGSAGIFRARIPQDGYGAITCQISLEHGLCEIGDFIIKAEIEETTKTLAQAAAQIFGYYGGSRWQIGSVLSGNVTLAAQYGDNLLSALNGLVSQIPNAMISCDFSTSPWTLNIVSKGETVAAEGRLSRNVSSALIKKDDKDLCTRVYAEGLGADGAIGYLDADTASVYGIVEKKISTEGYTAQEAAAAAQSYLDKYKRPRYSVTVSGADFSHITGESLDRAAIGKLYRLTVPEDSVTVEENIIRISWPDVFGRPYDADLTLAEEDQTLVTFVKGTSDQSAKAEKEASAANIRTEALEEEVEKKDEEYTSKFAQTKQYIDTEVQRAKLDADGKYIAKEEDFQTIDDLLEQALTDAQAAASTAAAGCIAKTQTYQTAEAIVQSAAAIAATDAGSKYIAKTVQYQTADAIVTTAESYTDSATAGKLDKTAAYDTVDKILNKALTDAQAAATTAANGCIAKTATYQTASAIVSAAVAQSATDAGNTYIAKTTQYQTANAIVQAAETYTDGVDSRLSGQISTMSDKIALVVTQSGGNNVIAAASIVAAINDAGSSVVIDADHIDLNGYVTIGMLSSLEDAIAAVDTKATNAKNEADGIAQQLQTGLTVTGPVVATGFNATTGYVLTGSLNIGGYDIGVEPITINGTQYLVCTATAS